MSRKRVVIVDEAFGSVDAERAVAEEHGAEFLRFQCTTVAEARAAVAGADVAFVNLAPIDASVIASLAPGALVIRYGVGYDNVDVEAARAAGVRVANVPDYGMDTVADHTVALLLAGLRRIAGFDRAIRRDGWIGPTGLGEVRSFADTTVGLVGTGRIGLQVAARLAPFGFAVLAHDPYAPDSVFAEAGLRSVGLDELLASSHAVSLHCPLTPESHHLIDAAALARMRPDAILVNTSRGGLVDAAAVAAALASGRLGGAALDVFETEPLAADSPLRDRPEATLTPHVAFYSAGSLRKLQRLAAEEAGRALRGEPLRCAVVDGSGGRGR